MKTKMHRAMLVWMVYSEEYNQIRFMEGDAKQYGIGDSVLIMWGSKPAICTVVGAGYLDDTPTIRKVLVEKHKAVSVNMQNIVIPDEFIENPPHVQKLADRYEEWRRFKKFETRVAFKKYDGLGDGMYLLTDGYTAYLISKMMGLGTLVGELEEE